MYDDLVKRLREHNGWALNETLDQAADAIEELQNKYDTVTSVQKHVIENLRNDLDFAIRAEAAAAKACTPRWIPVTERLPDQNSGSLYICLIVGGEYDQLSWYELCDFAEGQFWIKDELYEGHVTHWMPLPEPPKEE